MGDVSVTVQPYGGWERCLHLSNGLIDMVVPLAVGPRVIHFGAVGGANQFCEFPEDLGCTGGESWRPYGGHRLWYAPEHPVTTYYPDNGPVAFEARPGGALVVQEPERTTGLQKSLCITLAPDRASVTVLHRISNRGDQTRELAPWAMSVMAPGGEALLPSPGYLPHPEGLLPNRAIAVWPYTNLADPRITWGARLTRIRQDAAVAGNIKLGMTVPDGWVAYVNGGSVFHKRFGYLRGAAYPDFGCSAEVFANERMLELETLGPLVRLAPGEAAEHAETWSLRSLQSGLTDEELCAFLADL
jgi:hypothetical protein